MMNVNFTGINNVRIGNRPAYKEACTYIDAQSKLKTVNKIYTDIKFRVDLCDDKTGNDFSDFINRIKQAKEMYFKHCVDKRKPNTIEFQMIRYDIENDKTNNSIFKLNNYELILDDDSILPLYSFFARLTRQGAKNKNLNKKHQSFMELMNKSIQKETVEYIENK